MNWVDMTVAEKDDMMRTYLKQGEDAYMDSEAIMNCPHNRNSQMAQWWRRGYQNAAYGVANESQRDN